MQYLTARDKSAREVHAIVANALLEISGDSALLNNVLGSSENYPSRVCVAADVMFLGKPLIGCSSPSFLALKDTMEVSFPFDMRSINSIFGNTAFETMALTSCSQSATFVPQNDSPALLQTKYGVNSV